jgi:hypothetical protein
VAAISRCVGGFAVAAHGHPRATRDIDICPESSDANLRRLAVALAELEAEPIGLDDFQGEFDLEPDFDGLRMDVAAEAERRGRMSLL